MPRTLRDYGLTVILCIIMLITVAIMMPFFGPQPLSNPIAVVTLLVVLITSCCLLSMNQYITASIKSRKQRKKITTKFKTTKSGDIICPYCRSILKPGTTYCTHCRNEL